MNSTRGGFQGTQTTHHSLAGRNTFTTTDHFQRSTARPLQDHEETEELPRFWIGARTRGGVGENNKLTEGHYYGCASLKDLRFYLSIDIDRIDHSLTRLIYQQSALAKASRMQSARIRGLGELFGKCEMNNLSPV